MMQRTIRIALPVAVLAASAPMLAADAPIVDPTLRAGSWTATASEVQIGGKLPPGAVEGVEQKVLKPRIICFDPGSSRSLLEAFAGGACNTEQAGVHGQRFSGKMVCTDEKTFGTTSYEGSFGQTSADVDLTIDMSFRDQEWRMFMTTHVKFEWQGEGCGTRN